MTRSFRHPRRKPRSRHVDPGVTNLGFTCFRVDPGFDPIEALFPRITMAMLVQPPAAAWLRG